MSDVVPVHSPPELCQDNAPPPILPEELIVQIMSWLPVKSLVRFRCVCKYWKSLISDPNFVKLHLQISSRNPSVLIASIPKTSDSDVKYIYTQPCTVRSLIENPTSIVMTEDRCCLFNTHKYQLIDSCNGLVCLVGYSYNKSFLEKWVCFWNPATRSMSKRSPSLLVDFQSHPFSDTTMLEYGFGYDNLTDTYKVVVVLYDQRTKVDSHMKVYSWGDNCWRNIQSFHAVPFRDTISSGSGKFVSGTLNWLAVPNIDSRKQVVIISVDLGKETSRQLLLPAAIDEVKLDEVPITELKLGVLMDRLCLSCGYKGTHFVLWQMKEFGVQESWTQLVSVSYQELQIDSLLDVQPLFAFHVHENGDVLIRLRQRTDSGGELQVIMYNQRDNRIEHPKTSNSFKWMYEMPYVQSLVSPS